MEVLIRRVFPMGTEFNDRGLVDREHLVDVSYAQIAKTSCDVSAILAQDGIGIVRWIESWVCRAADGKYFIFCHHDVDQFDSVREHSTRGNFPFDMSQVWEAQYVMRLVGQNDSPYRAMVNKWPTFAILRQIARFNEGGAAEMLLREWDESDMRPIVVESMIMTTDTVFMVVHASNEATIRDCFATRNDEEVFCVIRVLDPSMANEACAVYRGPVRWDATQY